MIIDTVRAVRTVTNLEILDNGASFSPDKIASVLASDAEHGISPIEVRLIRTHTCFSDSWGKGEWRVG